MPSSNILWKDIENDSTLSQKNLPNPLCVQISKVDANTANKTEKILHENPCKMGQAATGQGKQAQLNVTRILGIDIENSD